MSKNDHIVMNGKKEGRFECRNCGATEDPGFPAGIDETIAKIKVFSDAHTNCVNNATKKLTFRGHSDDTVSIHTCKVIPNESVRGSAEEYGCAGDDIVLATFSIGEKMLVNCLYDGCWSFSVGQVAEDIPLPDWPVELKGSSGYTAILEITVPSLVEVERSDGSADDT